jgi:uncharacterized protein
LHKHHAERDEYNTMTILFALLLIVVLLASWALTLLSLPGNWLMVAATALYACFVPAASPAGIGWKVVAATVVLAVVGEVVELAAGAAETTRAGGTRRGAALALVGSVVGALVGVLVGLPIPLAGSVVAAVLFAGLGAMAGAMLGEVWAGRKLDASWKIGAAAFRGRLLGTLGKMLIGGLIVAVVVAALVLP